MRNYIVGCGQITWMTDWQNPPPRELAMQDIAAAGYDGAPLHALPGETAEDVAAFFARFDLKAGPGYLGANWWDPAETDKLVEQARVMAEMHAALGCDVFFVADGGFMVKSPRGIERMALAGRPTPEDSLSPDQYKIAGEALTRAGEAALASGVRICFHNHVGSFIETRQEIDDLWAQVDRSKVFQGPDIGHLAWAGVDTVQFCRDYAADIKALHIKDIDRAVMDKGIAEGWHYMVFNNSGVFAELGEGFVPYPQIFELLDKAGFNGWLIVETDRTTKATPLESATISRAYLRSLGI
ncbi:MAG: sugar phosphate isomerase/epimerase family protein [Anaerolineae bacterium]|jgi:inosose dehydratase|nr:TIM barrel protein [Chloroflexota bacterium]